MRCEIPTGPCEPGQQGRITSVNEPLHLDETLRHHGDAELAPGLVDLAVNVRSAPMPEWLTAAITRSLHDLARYPDPAPVL